jgi:hypothetical protein
LHRKLGQAISRTRRIAGTLVAFQPRHSAGRCNRRAVWRRDWSWIRLPMTARQEGLRTQIKVNSEKAGLIMVNGLGAGAPRRLEYLHGYCSRKPRSACRRLLRCYAGVSGPSPCQNRTGNAPTSWVRMKSRPIRQMRPITSAHSRRPRSLSGAISPPRPTRRQLVYARLDSRSVCHRADCHISRPIAGPAARPPLASGRALRAARADGHTDHLS